MLAQTYRCPAIVGAYVSLIMASLLPVLAAAQTPGTNEPLDVRPGLYEVTLVTTYRAHVTADAAAKLTPEQRRTAETSYAQGAKPQTQKTMFCAVPADMRPGDYLQASGPECTKETASSSQKSSAHMTCPNGNETWNFERIDSQHFKSFMRRSAADGSMTIEQTRDSKWLRDSCAKTPPPASSAAAASGGTPPPVETPLMKVRTIQQPYGYASVVANLSKVPMTAYAIALEYWGNPNFYLRYYDARMNHNPPIKPGASSVDPERKIIVGGKPVAAIFADGSTFGDPKQIAILMKRRAYQLKGLAAMASILCDAERRGLDRQAAVASIAASRAHEPSGDTQMDSDILDFAYKVILDPLSFKPPSTPISMDEALARIQKAGTPLLEDPVKDANGLSYLKTGKEALFCSAAR